MTKILIDEAVAKFVLNAIDDFFAAPDDETDQEAQEELLTARSKLRQALADAGLDKMADNASELGLDYEQPQYSDIVSDGGLDPRNKFDTPPAPPECKTAAEMTAFAFGWYKALELARGLTMAQAVQTVIKAMQDDPEYAWSWHCNIAMAFVDAGGDRYTANQGAARFLELFAKVQPAHELPAPAQLPPNCGTGYCSCIECVMEPAQPAPEIAIADAYRAGVDSGIAAEREACAKVCDDWPNGREDVYSIGVAIRARSST